MKHAERVMQIINDALDTYTGFSKQESELRQKLIERTHRESFCRTS